MAQTQYRVTYQDRSGDEHTTLISAHSRDEAHRNFQKQHPGIFPLDVKPDTIHELIRAVTTVIAAVAAPRLKSGAGLIGSVAANVADVVRDNEHLSFNDIVAAAKRAISL